MVPEHVMRSLSKQTPSKIVLLVLDGLGGLPVNGRTALEAADCPTLDRLADDAACGVTIPVARGITPGSGPAHLGLFGYDPLNYEIGRGVLEALGVGLEMTDRDVACRGNLATLKNGLITSRRGGPDEETRISAEEGPQVSERLAEALKEVSGAEIILEPGKEHRFTILFRGDDLDGRIADADPQKTGLAPLPAAGLAPEAEATAAIVNDYIAQATDALKDRDTANTVLLRGFTKYPEIPTMGDLFNLKPACIATYPMYRGLAQLVGMDVLDAGDTIESEFKTLAREFANHDFFYVHIKKTDSYGEDGNFKKKVEVIEELDHHLSALLALEPDVICVTADHSTPALMKGHSWHPCPFMLWSKYCLPDHVRRYTELDCAQGSLGSFPAVDAVALMLGNALKLDKFGA